MVRVCFIILWTLPILVYGEPVTIHVNKEMCNKLIVDHIPDADVNYKEDEDVNENKVVPATLNNGGLGSALTNKIKKEGVKIELSMHIKPFTNFPPAPAGVDYLGAVINLSKTILGYLTIKEGELLLDDKPLGDDLTSKIKRECIKLKKKDNKKVQ